MMRLAKVESCVEIKKKLAAHRYLALVRNLLRMACNEWQGINGVPKIRLLLGEV